MYAVCKDEKYSLDMAMWKMLGRKIGTLGSVIDGTSEQPYLYTAQEQAHDETRVPALRGTSGEDELTAFFAETSESEARRKQKSAPPAKGSIETFFKPKAALSAGGKSKSSFTTSATNSTSTSSTMSSSSLHLNRASTGRPLSSSSPTEHLVGKNFMATTTPAAASAAQCTQMNGHAGMISWTCNGCTFENKKEQNSSDWYTCELCTEPHMPEACYDDDRLSLGGTHVDLLAKSTQNNQEALSEKKAISTSGIRVGVGMISWICKECTFQNKKYQNKSSRYTCEMCSEPHVPEWDLVSDDDDDELSLESNHGHLLTSLSAAAPSRSYSATAVISKRRSAPTARVSTESSVEIIEIDSTPAKHSQSNLQPKEVIMLDDDGDDESTSNRSEIAATQSSATRKKPSPPDVVPPKKKQHLLEFSVSKNSGRITIYESGGKSSLINFDIEQVLTSETCDALMEAKTNRGKPQRSGPSSFRSPTLCFNPDGVNAIVQRLKRTITDSSVESFSSELKLLVRSYISLREVEKKALKDSGESFAPVGLSQSAARIMSRSLVASTTTTSTERYGGGAKERAIENQKNGTATQTDEAVLKGQGCAWCSSDLTRAQRIAKAVYCSQECAEAGRLRRGGWASTAIRSAMFALEAGVCKKCNINAHAFYEQIMALEPAERLNRYQSAKWRMPASNRAYQAMLNDPKEGDFWQVDHKVAVVEGGGNCGLENLRTLCVPCHREETEKLRVRLKLASPSKQTENNHSKSNNAANSSGDIGNKPAAQKKRKQVDIRAAFFGAASASSQKRLCRSSER
jgi:HNH endonuclease